MANRYALRLIISEKSERADRAVVRELHPEWPHLSRAIIKSWFQKKRVLLGGRPLSPTDRLPTGEYEIEIEDWDPQELKPPRALPSPQGCFLNVLYEDNELLIFDKPSGVPSVPLKPNETKTAVNAALAYRPALAQVGRSGLEPGILHRLDTGTSGLLVFAKTDAEFERLREIWKNGGVRKEYRALVRTTDHGEANRIQRAKCAQTPMGRTAAPQLALSAPLKSPILIDSPLSHDPKSDRRMVLWDSLSPALRGRERHKPLRAVTRILGCQSIAPSFFDLDIVIETGVMHQIRCHLSSHGWPILGDSVYRGIPSRRLWLHAWRLSLPRADGTRVEVEAPLPEAWPHAGPEAGSKALPSIRTALAPAKNKKARHEPK